MGKSGVISEEEQRMLQEFWVYCQPVDLYSCLAGRQRCNPIFLNRSLCYHREVVQTPDSVRGHAGSLQLELSGLSEHPVSVLAALCHRTAAQEFVPLCCTLLHLPATEAGARTDSAGAAAASLTLLNAAAVVNGGACDMVLLLLALEQHSDLRHLKPQQGARMTSRLRPGLAFGLVPDGAEVSWGYVAVATQVLASQQFVSLGEVLLTLGNLQLRQTCSAGQQNGRTAAALVCCTFTANAHQLSAQPRWRLWVKVRRERTALLLADTADSKVRVFYQYFYHNDERHVVEKVVGYRCSFCEMACRSLTGLQQHLEASHDLFVYGFPRDHPDVVPSINVHIAPDIYNSRGEFVQLDIDAYHLPANKEFFFACPRRQRAVRVQQYEQQPDSSEPVGRPEAAARSRNLQASRTALREPIARIDSIDDSTASDQQAAEGVPAVAARRKGGRLQPLPLPRKPPGTRYYHSRSCISMTREEAEASVDSDDEPDTEAWRRRAREQLTDTQNLDEMEKEFVLNWNSTMNSKPIYGDVFLPGRVQDFAREHAQVIAGTPKLRECFVNFLMILWDYCLLSSEDVDACAEIVAAA